MKFALNPLKLILVGINDLQMNKQQIQLFNYNLMSIWGAYVENLYDLVAIIHRVAR